MSTNVELWTAEAVVVVNQLKMILLDHGNLESNISVSRAQTDQNDYWRLKDHYQGLVERIKNETGV
jgi:hypothetical protein